VAAPQSGTNGEDARSKSEGLLAATNQDIMDKAAAPFFYEYIAMYPPRQRESSLNKWDNHNTIARGWAGAKTNYHPVTFRAIYNVESQKA